MCIQPGLFVLVGDFPLLCFTTKMTGSQNLIRKSNLTIERDSTFEDCHF